MTLFLVVDRVVKRSLMNRLGYSVLSLDLGRKGGGRAVKVLSVLGLK